MRPGVARWRARSGRVRRSRGGPVAEPGRVGGEVLDGVVIEVGGLDPAGDAGLGQQPADPACEGVDVGGGVAFGGPALAEHDVGGGVGGAAERPPVGEQVPHGRVYDLVGGPLGGQGEDDACGAAAGYQVAGQAGEGFPLGLGADGGGEVGVLVDRDEVDVLAGVAGDLAAAGGQELAVPVVHDALEMLERGDRVGDGRADELVGAGPPHAQLG